MQTNSGAPAQRVAVARSGGATVDPPQGNRARHCALGARGTRPLWAGEEVHVAEVPPLCAGVCAAARRRCAPMGADAPARHGGACPASGARLSCPARGGRARAAPTPTPVRTGPRPRPRRRGRSAHPPRARGGCRRPAADGVTSSIPGRRRWRPPRAPCPPRRAAPTGAALHPTRREPRGHRGPVRGGGGAGEGGDHRGCAARRGGARRPPPPSYPLPLWVNRVPAALRR